MPAVFIEFGEMVWKEIRTNSSGRLWRATVSVTLHIVTAWAGSTDSEAPDREKSLEYLDIPELVLAAVNGLSGDGFSGMQLQGTIVNHNHEEIVDSIEMYRVSCERTL